MSVRPDRREASWYDLMNMFSIDPDSMPHYYTTVFDKFKMLDDNRHITRPICNKCNSALDMIEFRGLFYCPNEYDCKYRTDRSGDYIVSSIKKKDKFEEKHKIVVETAIESLNRMIEEICNKLIEPSGNKLDIYTVESCMFGKTENQYFVTKNGYVKKSEIKKWLYGIKQYLISELTKMSNEIRFSSSMKTPALRLG